MPETTLQLLFGVSQNDVAYLSKFTDKVLVLPGGTFFAFAIPRSWCRGVVTPFGGSVMYT
jgi:hypothetical protein